MRVVKCTSNHFFDADKYTTCPQCGAAQQSNSAAGAPANKAKNSYNNASSPKASKAGETFGVFKNKVAKKSPFKTPESNNYEKLKSFQPEPVSQKPIWEREAQNEPIVFEESTSVQPLADSPDPAPVASPVTPSIAPAPVAPEVPAAPVVPVPAPADVQHVDTESNQESTLLEEIKKVASDNDGKTVGFFSSGKSSVSSDSSEDKYGSEQVPANVPSEEPVVGWLICIEGPNIGQCFNIYAGKNSLGRSNTNKIIVNKDRSISRDKHSWIIYEPKKRDFFAQPGDSSGLTYVNDEVIMQPTKLEKKTIIEVGNTKLMLIPLCGDDFSWEDYLK